MLHSQCQSGAAISGFASVLLSASFCSALFSHAIRCSKRLFAGHDAQRCPRYGLDVWRENLQNMPRLRSQTRRPALRVLPHDVLRAASSFCHFDQALEQSKSRKTCDPPRGGLSRATLAADGALLQGAEERPGLAVGGANGRCDLLRALLTFRAAWALDQRPGSSRDPPTGTITVFTRCMVTMLFLKIVEPTIDGLQRVVAACDRFVESSQQILTENSCDACESWAMVEIGLASRP